VKTCFIIAGPNGAGKTTFAKSFLPSEGQCVNFINVDMIAEGLSPLAPDKVRIEAGRLVLKRIAKCVVDEESFAFETTLSGTKYAKHIEKWKKTGYEVVLYFLRLPSAEIAIDRVRLRVSQGGHNVPEEDICRRFDRGWKNFRKVYQDIVDAWIIFDTSDYEPKIIEESK